MPGSRQQRLNLYRHAGIYAIINAAILVLGLVLPELHAVVDLGLASAWMGHRPGDSRARHADRQREDFTEHDEGMKWWHENQRRQATSR